MQFHHGLWWCRAPFVGETREGGKGCEMAKHIRCYAEGRGDEWTAICLNFDIAVQGHSFEDVKECLEGAIDLFLEGVAELPAKDRNRLLRRSAPVSMLKYLRAVVWSWIFGDSEDGEQHQHHYTMPFAGTA